MSEVDSKAPEVNGTHIAAKTEAKAVSAIISPSMLSADFGFLARDAQRMVDAGADTLHVDVMDGYVRARRRGGRCALRK